MQAAHTNTGHKMHHTQTPFSHALHHAHIPPQRVDGHSCLFGETLTVERRLVNVCCYSGGDYTRVISTTPCTCIPDDYEWLVGMSLHGAHTPLEGGHTPLEGGHTPLESGHTPLEGGHTPLEGGHTPLEGAHCQGLCCSHCPAFLTVLQRDLHLTRPLGHPWGRCFEAVPLAQAHLRKSSLLEHCVSAA